jgi:hypothetical protein
MRNPGESPQAEQLSVLKRETSGKGATLGDVFKEKLEIMKKSPSKAPPPPEPEASTDEEAKDEEAKDEEAKDEEA